MHLGTLKSTPELSAASQNFPCASITRHTRTKRGKICKSHIFNIFFNPVQRLRYGCGFIRAQQNTKSKNVDGQGSSSINLIL